MEKPRVISSDSHPIEPPNLWTRTIGERYGERTPRVAREADGGW